MQVRFKFEDALGVIVHTQYVEMEQLPVVGDSVDGPLYGIGQEDADDQAEGFEMDDLSKLFHMPTAWLDEGEVFAHIAPSFFRITRRTWCIENQNEGYNYEAGSCDVEYRCAYGEPLPKPVMAAVVKQAILDQKKFGYQVPDCFKRRAPKKVK